MNFDLHIRRYRMDTNYFTTRKKQLGVLLLIGLIIFCIIASMKSIMTQIIEPDIPLGTQFEAMFYVENKDSGTMTCIGDGLINSATEVYGNAKAVKEAIITSPDYSAYLPADTRIVWTTINVVEAECRVIGQLRQIDIVSISDYGAIGDGVTDNYQAIQKAIDDAVAMAQPMDVPAGIYYVSKKIVIPGSLKIQGSGPTSSIIIFKDEPNTGDYKSYLQRGLISFKGSGLTVENVAFKYEANNTTPYKREAGKSGTEGVLFFLGDASNVTFRNSEITVSGNCNPSMTSVWVKSELADINNVTFERCTINNYSESTVGGGLWISGHDNKNTIVNKVTVNKCTFNKCGHDEAFGLWGHNVSNCILNESTLNYIGTSTNIQTVASLGNPSYEEQFNNVTIYGNTFNLSGEVRNAVSVQILTDNSTVNVSANKMYCNFPSDKSFVCFALTKCGNSSVNGNVIEIIGGNNISFISFDKTGVAKMNNNRFTATDCNRWVLIQSKYSTDFVGGDVTISDSKFNVATKNTTKGLPVIQFPLSSKLTISGTLFDTSKSNVHEIVLQTLSKNNVPGTYNNPVEFIHVATDANLVFNVNSDYSRTIKLDYVATPNLYYSFSNNSKLEQLQMSNCTYNNFYLNYKKTTPAQLNTYVKSLSLN